MDRKDRRAALWRKLALAAVTLAVMAAVAALSAWDDDREAAAALEDFGEEQGVVARAAAAELSARLDEARRDAQLVAQTGEVPPFIADRYLSVSTADAPPTPDGAWRFDVPVAGAKTVHLVASAHDLLGGVAQLEQAHALLLFVKPPGATAWQAMDGRTLAAAVLERPGAVTRADAARLGLPERTAMAGVSHFDAGPLGRWSVAAVATAARERDRERRGFRRLMLAVVVAGGLVLAAGALALRIQRRELELLRTLALERAGRERDERLERLTKVATMGTLASGIAHELATPLGVIAGRAEQLLGRGHADERVTRAARAILDEANRIRDVVRGFLGLARGEAPLLTDVDPDDVVAGAMLLVEHRFEQSGVTLSRERAGGLPRVRGDRRLLEQALVNLLLNACDACRRGGAVTVRAQAEAGGVAFEVTDDGQGVPAEHAARLTEPFFTTKPSGEGTGLGLAITNEIVKSHRGKLSFNAAQPRGTRACLHIPTASANATGSGAADAH